MEAIRVSFCFNQRLLEICIQLETKPCFYSVGLELIQVHCFVLSCSAVIAQQWSAKVVSTPSHLSPRVGPILLKCDVDLMGGGRDFIEVTGWKRDDKFIRGRSQRLYGEYMHCCFVF